MSKDALTNWSLTAIFVVIILLAKSPYGTAQFLSKERAYFCKNHEAVEPCGDGSYTIDRFNNIKVYPILQKLLQKDFFKFYKVNMEKPCPFWPDDRQCASKECGIESCDDEVPAALRTSRFFSWVRSKNFRNSDSKLKTNQTSATKLHSKNNTARVIVSNEPDLTNPSPCATTTNKNTHSKSHLNSISHTLPAQKEQQYQQTNFQKDQSLSAESSSETKERQNEIDPNQCNTGNQFDPLDRSLTEGDRAQLADMDWYEDSSDRFCDVEDDDSTNMHYVNLLRNPERYTGYKGNSALKVWQSIYQENCFKPDPRFDKDFLLHPCGNTGMCLEKRVFYRLISGLHSAITVSIAAHNYKPDPTGFGSGTWFRNVDMFKGRFGTKWSWEGPERLMNVYFVYLLELRALVKVSPYLEKEIFYTGNEKEDAETRLLMEQLFELGKTYQDHFDENSLFTGPEYQARLLREEFRQHFMNISRIMDCVGCDKCRLWGKLQTHGMGTALKILFSGLPLSHYHSIKSGDVKVPFKLTRNDVVALIQSFGRYSSTIREVEEFRNVMTAELPYEKNPQSVKRWPSEL